jgi:hypothetical protein
MNLFTVSAVLFTLLGESGNQTPQTFVYSNESSSLKILFRNDRVVIGQINEEDLSDKNQLFLRQSERVSHIEAPSAKICIGFSQIILATPKTLRTGARYTCAGVKFNVQKCLEARYGLCQRAIISSNCAHIIGTRCVIPAPVIHFRGIAVGAPYFFIYSPTRGILDIALGNDFSKASNHLLIRGNKGIL